MEKRKRSQIVADSIGETVKENAASIAEAIPVVGTALSKVVEVAQKTGEKIQGTEKPPRFMQAVMFYCKKNQILSERQQGEIELILQKDYESPDSASLEDIEYFIDTYVGGEVHTEFIEDCIIEENRLWIHLFEDEQYPYDGECLQKTMKALNTLLREEVFDRVKAWGHDEDYRYE